MPRWTKKPMEEKKTEENVSDPRIQSYRNDEDRVAAAVEPKKTKLPDEPRELMDDKAEEIGEGLKVVKFEVVMPELMYKKALALIKREDYFGLNDFVCECVRVRTVCVEDGL